MSDALLWNEMGNIYIRIGSLDEAIAAFSKAIDLNPDFGWAYFNLGHAYFQKGEYGRSLFLFRKCFQFMKTSKNQALVLNKIGDTYRALKDIENSILAYKKADELSLGVFPSRQESSKQTGALVGLREMNKKEGRVPERKGLLSDLPEPEPLQESTIPDQEPDNGFRPENVGEEYLESVLAPDWSETQQPTASNSTVKANEKNPEPKVDNRQNAARLIRHLEKSPSPREKPLIVIPDPNEVSQGKPNVSGSETKPNSQEDSVTDKPRDGTRTIKPGSQSNIYPGIENLEEILAKVNIYENITQVNPNNDRAWDTLGKLYKSLGRYKDAINAYLKAIEIAPEREVYHYYLGLLYSVEKRHDEAIRAFQFVLHKNPEYVLAHSALAGVYHRMGLENKANHHIATALPKMNTESTYNRACFYAICGDTELALEFLQQALANKDTTIEWIKSDPDLDPIRNDQRYLEMISEKDGPEPDSSKENYFSSKLDGAHNQLLPILNRSLAR